MRKISILAVIALFATAFINPTDNLNSPKERVYVANSTLTFHNTSSNTLLLKVINLDEDMEGVESVALDKEVTTIKDLDEGITRTITFTDGTRLVEKFKETITKDGFTSLISEVIENPWNKKIDECLRVISDKESGTQMIYIFSYRGDEGFDMNKDASAFISKLHQALK